MRRRIKIWISKIPDNRTAGETLDGACRPPSFMYQKILSPDEGIGAAQESVIERHSSTPGRFEIVAGQSGVGPARQTLSNATKPSYS